MVGPWASHRVIGSTRNGLARTLWNAFKALFATESLHDSHIGISRVWKQLHDGSDYDWGHMLRRLL